jgi:hypothetical protein
MEQTDIIERERALIGLRRHRAAVMAFLTHRLKSWKLNVAPVRATGQLFSKQPRSTDLHLRLRVGRNNSI